jgi:hypothetical protein
MKTGIALLPEVERTQAITFSLADYLLSNKYLTKKQILDVVNELETVVLTASLYHDQSWDQIHYKVNKISTQQERSKKSQITRSNQKNQLQDAVEKICNDSPSTYMKLKIESSVKEIILNLEKNRPDLPIKPTAIRDHFRAWRNCHKKN